MIPRPSAFIAPGSVRMREGRLSALALSRSASDRRERARFCVGFNISLAVAWVSLWVDSLPMRSACGSLGFLTGLGGFAFSGDLD